MCISTLGWPKGSVEEPWTSSRKTCGEPVLQKLNAGTKRGSARSRALISAGNKPQRCVRRRLRSVSLTTPPRYAAAPCFGFYRCCAQPVRARRRAAFVPSQLGAEPLTRRPHGRAPRASSYGRNPRAARAIGLAGGRGLYPTASSQPTARGRAPARLRALERAPCRAPCRAPGPNPGLLPLGWADWRSAS